MDLSVFIVDDDVMLGKIQKALVKSVWPLDEPIICYDGPSALERIELEAASGKKILILLDINMPEMDGWGVLDFLCEKSYGEHVWVILNTSSEEVADEIKSRSYTQVIAYNKKPLKREILRELMGREPLAVFF
ncbi:response regulator [Parapedobacter pyrenivorans]|uniref:Response regulator n=1 Tax=Parapedobacter pyrenivorans TaxID=1305674 RepID=A0A917M273_9SPHI|nr:response regulator [Parapedobacter pyrenivorans]GGG73116.1 response regulator [Parapedobacter pyrenivorans]